MVSFPKLALLAAWAAPVPHPIQPEEGSAHSHGRQLLLQRIGGGMLCVPGRRCSRIPNDGCTEKGVCNIDSSTCDCFRSWLARIVRFQPLQMHELCGKVDSPARTKECQRRVLTIGGCARKKMRDIDVICTSGTGRVAAGRGTYRANANGVPAITWSG